MHIEPLVAREHSFGGAELGTPPLNIPMRLRKQLIIICTYLRAPPYRAARNSPANPGSWINTRKTKCGSSWNVAHYKTPDEWIVTK